jgi:hypothetical protein
MSDASLDTLSVKDQRYSGTLEVNDVFFFTRIHEGPQAMKKDFSCEKVGFQKFPSRPKPTWSGHGYSFQLAKTQSRTNPH